MKRQGDALESAIREGLERWSNAEVPEDTDLWPKVARRLEGRDGSRKRARGPKRWGLTRSAAGAVLLCALLAISGMTIAAAASPAVRTELNHLWPFGSGSVSQGYSATGAPLFMRPVPRFHVFYPAHIPSGLGVRGFGHILQGGLRNPKQMEFGLSYNCPKSETPRACGSATSPVWQMFPPSPSGPAFFPAVVSGVTNKGVESVWLGFHAPLPGKAYVSVGEWLQSAYPAPSVGDSETINGWPARLQRQGERLQMSLYVDGTAIVVETNLSRTSIERFVASLRLRAIKAKR